MNGAPEKTHLEIERRFLIVKPDEDALRALPQSDYTDIVQTYLIGEAGTTDRVRKRGRSGRYAYTHTVKRRLSGFTHCEEESEISESEYQALLTRADKEKRVVCKRRYTLPRNGHIFEIDLYPFWDKQAIMEVELSREDETVTLPGEISLLREITGNRLYSNYALATAIPEEDR